MGHTILKIFLISIVLICSIRVTESQNIDLKCRKYASDVKCEVLHNISVNITVDIKKVTSEKLQQKQLDDAPVLVLSRDHQIESLPQKIGQHFKKLKELIVNLIGLKIVRRSDFNDMSGLKTLNLANNKLTEIPSDTFDDLQNLTILFISGNKIKNIEPSLLRNLKMLRAFNAQSNELEILDDIFTENLQLESINLNDNKLREIKANFKNLSKIKYIDLRNNSVICTRCAMRNEKALNKTLSLCSIDDEREKIKVENRFESCVKEALKTNLTYDNHACTKNPSFTKCIMERMNENSDEKIFLNSCVSTKTKNEDSVKKNLEMCLYCNDNIKDITNHAKMCGLRYSEFSIYNITTFDAEVKNFFK